MSSCKGHKGKSDISSCCSGFPWQYVNTMLPFRNTFFNRHILILQHVQQWDLTSAQPGIHLWSQPAYICTEWETLKQTLHTQKASENFSQLHANLGKLLDCKDFKVGNLTDPLWKAPAGFFFSCSNISGPISVTGGQRVGSHGQGFEKKRNKTGSYFKLQLKAAIVEI